MVSLWISSLAGSRRSTILTDYCYHVASVVGLSCLHIWGYRSEGGKAERLAESCGIALQLTNIIRDVREDARNGRIYLPEEDLERFGVTRRRVGGTRAAVPTSSVNFWPLKASGHTRIINMPTGCSPSRSGWPPGSQDDRWHLLRSARRDRASRI